MLSPIMKIFAFAPLAFFFLPFFLSCFLKKKKEERISYEMLSDQYEITTKVALFQGTDKEQFRDRKEFTGSILKQLEDVYQFIDLVNKTKATFSGLNRTDKRDYPEEAVREALLNSIVHRDYSFSGSNLVNVFEDRIEFVSLGGLVSCLELKSIFFWSIHVEKS